MKQRTFSTRIAMLFSAVIILLVPLYSSADENPVHLPQHDLSSYLPVDSGISTLRYATTGFGRFPYYLSSPGRTVRMSLDGVPVAGLSPFGVDMEHVPLNLVKSYDIDSMGNIDIETIEVVEDEPVSTVGFLSGPHRRSVVEYAFARKTGERSGIVFGATSQGAHEHERSLKNSMRDYYLSSRHTLENGAEASVTLRGSRDREGLFDLDVPAKMGERKTDHLSASLRLRDYPVGEFVKLNSTAWYQNNNSRFDRNTVRKSLDDDNAGFNAEVLGNTGDSEYRVSINHLSRFFDSRIHHESWTREESRLSGSWTHKTPAMTFSMTGGLLYSSEYGGGSEAGVEITRNGGFGEEIVLNLSRYDYLPAAGMEYYPSLTFSDSSRVSDLEINTLKSAELGVRYQSERISWGAFVFGNDGEVPMFNPSSTVLDIMVSQPATTSVNSRLSETNGGGRWYLTLHGGDEYIYSISSRGAARFSSQDHSALWLYPEGDTFTDARLSKGLLDSKLYGTVFGSMELLWWDDYHTGPRGGHMFLDAGVSFKVSTLELYYKIENLTNEDVIWFDTFGRFGMNTMWGLTWTLRN